MRVYASGKLVHIMTAVIDKKSFRSTHNISRGMDANDGVTAMNAMIGYTISLRNLDKSTAKPIPNPNMMLRENPTSTR